MLSLQFKEICDTNIYDDIEKNTEQVSVMRGIFQRAAVSDDTLPKLNCEFTETGCQQQHCNTARVKWKYRWCFPWKF